MCIFLQHSTAEEDEAGEAGANRPRLNEEVLYIFLKDFPSFPRYGMIYCGSVSSYAGQGS